MGCVLRKISGSIGRAMLPSPSQSLKEMSIPTLLAMLIWGEGRGTIMECKLAIGCVVRNRVNHPSWWGVGWYDVILKPWQFSCFNPSDPNRHKLKEPLKYDKFEVWEECCIAAFMVYEDLVEDYSNGATHYYSGTTTPSWAMNKTPVKIIKNHHPPYDTVYFYNLS